MLAQPVVFIAAPGLCWTSTVPAVPLHWDRGWSRATPCNAAATPPRSGIAWPSWATTETSILGTARTANHTPVTRPRLFLLVAATGDM